MPSGVNGPPRHSKAQAGWRVTPVLGLSRSHGNRKLRGLVPMTLDEISRIAEHFGETLLHALEPCLAHGMEPAVLMLGDLKVPCEVMLGETLRPPFEDVEFFAIGVPGSFLVVPAKGLTLPARQVNRLHLHLNQAYPKQANGS
ncbi:helix-turn-helix domain-containing protein, partial [Azohydromonas lata]